MGTDGTGDRLRPLWDFDDLDATEARFRAQLELEESPDGRAEVLTQLGRVSGLRGEFEDADRLLDEADVLAGADGVARTYVDLERGRVRRSSGDREAALPLFVAAYERAAAEGHDFLAGDAAHMSALAAPDRDGFVRWSTTGVAVAEERPAASYWLGPLLNNLGWEHYDAEEYDLALDAFERALAAREREPDKPGPIAIARYAVGKTLRALGRASDAIPQLEAAVASTADRGEPDGWFHEELAEEYAAVGRADDARTQAALAIPLLERDDPSFAGDATRRERLEALADA